MKKKAFDKKLILNKETVSNLNKSEMSGLKGGLGQIGSENQSCSPLLSCPC